MSRVCICVLCGLPGAGKSRVVQELKQFFHDRPYYLHVFDYDALGIVPDPEYVQCRWLLLPSSGAYN
jgi:hypothetical protein